MFDNEDLRQGILVASVKKRPWDNYKVTDIFLPYLQVSFLKKFKAWLWFVHL